MRFISFETGGEEIVRDWFGCSLWADLRPSSHGLAASIPNILFVNPGLCGGKKMASFLQPGFAFYLVYRARNSDLELRLFPWDLDPDLLWDNDRSVQRDGGTLNRVSLENICSAKVFSQTVCPGIDWLINQFYSPGKPVAAAFFWAGSNLIFGWVCLLSLIIIQFFIHRACLPFIVKSGIGLIKPGSLVGAIFRELQVKW